MCPRPSALATKGAVPARVSKACRHHYLIFSISKFGVTSCEWHDPSSGSDLANQRTTDRLRPFFGYYGGKWRDTPQYPAPLHRTIVEPFAGSAGYSLHFPASRVILYERDPIVAGVWDYLIKVKRREVLRLPLFEGVESVDDLNGVCPQAKSLIGFWLNRGVASPRKRPSKWMRSKIRPGSFWGERVRDTIAHQVEHIRHWKIRNRSYKACPVTTAATWFIDPPYETAGQHYRFGSKTIDYEELAAWCQSRTGQVIVCEHAGAKWLDFEVKAQARIKTTRRGRLSPEVWWYRPSQNGSGRSAC